MAPVILELERRHHMQEIQQTAHRPCSARRRIPLQQHRRKRRRVAQTGQPDGSKRHRSVGYNNNCMTREAVSYRAGWVNLGMAALAMVATLPGRTQGLGLVTEPLLRDMHLNRVTYATINLWSTLIGA